MPVPRRNGGPRTRSASWSKGWNAPVSGGSRLCVKVVARPARHDSGFHIRDMPMAQIDDVAPFARTGSTFITRALSVAGGP
jgi:hypothetical protein